MSETNTEKTVLISGASGFVGQRLTTELSSRGWQVYSLSRKLPKQSKEQSLHQLHWDPDKNKLDCNAWPKFEAIIHLAGESIASAWTFKHKQRIYDSRVKGTQLLVDQLRKAGKVPKTFIGISATGIYGNRPGEVLTEASSNGKGFLAMTAEDWEAATQPIKNGACRLCTTRLAAVLDPSGGMLQKILPIFKFGLGGTLGNGQQYFPWIGLTDVVRGLIFLLEKPELSGVFNFSASTPTNNQEFTTALASHLKRPAFLPAPAFILKLLPGKMGEELLLADTHVLPERLLQAGFQFQHGELGKFLKEEV